MTAAHHDAEKHPVACERRAISLIEMVVVIAVGGVLFTLTIVAFSRFLATSRSGQTHLERHLTLIRLAAQFRGDVWSAADAAGPADRPGTLLLSIPAGERIEYTFDDGRLQRTVLAGDAVRSRETFKLPGIASADWQIDAAKPRSRVTLRLDWAPGLTEAARERGEKSLQISATLAKDLRFLAIEEARP